MSGEIEERAELMRKLGLGQPKPAPVRHPLFLCYYLAVTLFFLSPIILIVNKERWFLRDAVVWFEDGQNWWRPEEISEWYYFSLWGLLAALLLFMIGLQM